MSCEDGTLRTHSEAFESWVKKKGNATQLVAVSQVGQKGDETAEGEESEMGWTFRWEKKKGGSNRLQL